MGIRIVLVFVILFAITSSSPTVKNTCEGNKTVTGYCNTLTYIDRTTALANPPTVSQCLDTCHGVLTDAGDWLVSFVGKPAGYVDVLGRSACGFALGRGQGEPMDYKFYMDNQDMVDIIDEIIKRFSNFHHGRVAAEGAIECGGHKATWFVN
jgi:hypothetical protein